MAVALIICLLLFVFVGFPIGLVVFARLTLEDDTPRKFDQ